ncbi:protein NUCLEAR FUSION DEFECTIVE 4-like [Heracleum sosnowskyi]|uniref:Protein NUCLEAR FUSION DEFECTIVE 4-like n=1 Tax=Heracleum sosnowskyi TaxID=360622 RepID=A0AAD8M8G8_9APIA|nr:protein NUCLEAR FUSION DEFECTIVE 4-like [Heracleum sosnowskyi]
MIIPDKWTATAASIWIQCSSGSSYAFGIYSPLLKSSQLYDQSTLDTVSVFKDIGANVGVISGLLYAAVSSRRRGPWVVHLVGAVLCLVGYFFIWLAVTGILHRPAVPVMCFFMFLASQAQTFFNTANVVVGVENFPEYGGTIVGIMKGFLGLSGAIIIQVYYTLLEDNPSSFLLMLALLPSLLPILLMFFVRTYETSDGHDIKHLNRLSLIALLLAAYILILIVLENTFTLQPWARIIILLLLLFFLFSPLKIAINAQREEICRTSSPTFASRTPLLHETESVVTKKNYAAGVPVENLDSQLHERQENDILENHPRQIGEEMNLLQAICTLDFWLLFVAMICGMGSGVATINNISQIGESLKYTSVERSTLVSLWSIWNFLGRCGAGYISDVYLHKRGWPRPFFMILMLAIMAFGHVIIAFGFPGNLYLGSVIVGVCYGSQWSLMPTITSEIFGVLHLGTIFNTIAIASPIGSYVMSVRIAGYIYDKEASGQQTCYGTHCFMLSFFIFAAVSLVGSLVASILFFRTRRFYKMVLLNRIRHSSRE